MTDLTQMPHAMRELARLESELQAKEEQARQAAENAAEQARIKAEDAGDAAALALLREMPALFAARSAVAAELVPILARFWKVETDIRLQEALAFQAVVNSQRFLNPSSQDRLARLRQAANLPDRADVGLQPPSGEGETLARTVLSAILAGALLPGALVVGRQSMGFDFKKD